MSLGGNFEQVLAAAQEGEEWAWRSLFDDLAGKVHGYLRLRGAIEPDDLVAEAFLDLARNINTFSGGEEDFRSWVFLIAHHRLLDERRTRRRRPADPVEPSQLDIVTDEDAETLALGRISTDRVRKLLDQLTPDQRDVIMLRVVAELSLAQTARVLGKRVNAVKALQHRAVGRLRRLIESEGVTR